MSEKMLKKDIYRRDICGFFLPSHGWYFCTASIELIYSR